jgi:hypothetical protein
LNLCDRKGSLLLDLKNYKTSRNTYNKDAINTQNQTANVTYNNLIEKISDRKSNSKRNYQGLGSGNGTGNNPNHLNNTANVSLMHNSKSRVNSGSTSKLNAKEVFKKSYSTYKDKEQFADAYKKHL